MSNALRNALMSSLESEVEQINPLTDHQETNLDEVLLEINEAAEPVAQAEEVVEVLETAEASVESLRSSLEGYIEQGGMSPQTATAHKVAMQIALQKLPLDVDKFTLSTESFGGDMDKLVASQEALEGVKEALAKLWEGIKNAVKKAWAAVVNFITTFGKSARAIKAAGQDLVKRAAATKGKAEGEFDATAAAKALHVGNKFDGNMVGARLKEVVAGGAAVTASAQAAEAGLKELAGKIASGHYEGDADRHAFADKVFKALPDKELPGGKGFEVGKSGESVLTTVTPLNITKVEVAAPSIEQIKQIGQGIVAVGDWLEKYSNGTFKALQKSVDQFVADQDKLVKKAGFSKEETEKTRAGLKDVTKASAIAKGAGPAYLSYAANTAKAAYGFGKKALAQYK